MKTENSTAPYPRHEQVGSVVVTIFDESKSNKPKYRVRWYVGKKRDSKTCDSPGTAQKFAIAKATELNNEERPPSKHELGTLRRKAMLWDEASTILAPHDWPVIRAVDTFGLLLAEMGDEGVRYFSHRYSPRLAKVRPTTVAVALEKYRQFITDHDQVSKDHQRNVNSCFKLFAEKFGSERIDRIECTAVDEWLESRDYAASTRDKWLYGLRGLFNYAKDYLKALPQTLPTECDLVRRTKGDKAPAEVFTIGEIITIGSHLPDKETLLALTLVLFGHLRQEEAVELVAENFNRDEQGIPNSITANNNVVKRKKGEFRARTIEIKPNLRRILAVLLPQKGPLFKSKSVFARIRRIAAALGIDWKHNALRHCCSSYAVAWGELEQKVADLSGHTVAVLRKNYLVSVAQEEARKYWKITFNTTRLAKLPRFGKTDLEAPKQAAAKRRARAAAGKPGDQLEIFQMDSHLQPIAA